MRLTREHFTKAIELISQPEHWTKGSYARTKDHRCIAVASRNATCWCAVGALAKVSGLDTNRVELLLTDLYPRQAVPQQTLSGTNDFFGREAAITHLHKLSNLLPEPPQ